MANSRFYSSTAQQTTLTGGITPSDTTMAVASTAGFPGSTPYTLAVDFGSSGMELVEVTGVASLTLTITRAIDGTSGASHSVGAIVRHVASARDFTDSRTHEAAIEDVHGLTGGADVVGTTSTQTLTNKTFSGGTISGTIAGTKTFTGVTNIEAGGNLAGTFTGTPTFSDGITITGSPTITNSPTGALTGVWTGNRTFNGTSTFGGTIQSSLAAAATVAHGSLVSGDTFDRYRIFADGGTEWGPGNAARDTNLYRSAANTLKTDDNLVVAQTLSVTGTASTGALTVTGAISATGTADFGFDEVTTGITYATDFGAGSMIRRSTAGVHVVDVEVVRTGATFTPANTSGNVTPDLTICTLPAGSRPPSALYVLASTGIGHGSLRINTDGTCELLTWIPDPVTITNSSTIRFTATWID